MVEPDDDDGNNFFDLNDPPLEHGNGMSKVVSFFYVCSSSMHVRFHSQYVLYLDRTEFFFL